MFPYGDCGATTLWSKSTWELTPNHRVSGGFWPYRFLSTTNLVRKIIEGVFSTVYGLFSLKIEPNIANIPSHFLFCFGDMVAVFGLFERFFPSHCPLMMKKGNCSWCITWWAMWLLVQPSRITLREHRNRKINKNSDLALFSLFCEILAQMLL